MSSILALDASTYAATVALLRDGELLGGHEVAMRGAREERLMPAVAALLVSHHVEVAHLEAIVCGAGPGSFTSLRIAAAIAKGLAFAAGIPLYGASSLLLMVAGSAAAGRPGSWLASLDAMRDERYAQLISVSEDGVIAAAGEPQLVAAADLPALAATSGAQRVGPGEPLDATPRAAGVARLLPQLMQGAPLSLDSWEPSYGRLAEAQVRWEATHGRSLEQA